MDTGLQSKKIDDKKLSSDMDVVNDSEKKTSDEMNMESDKKASDEMDVEVNDTNFGSISGVSYDSEEDETEPVYVSELPDMVLAAKQPDNILLIAGESDDEIGTELEATAARTIAERGVQLIGTAHGNALENLIKIIPQGMSPNINLTMTDDYPIAEAVVIISANK